MKRGYLLLLVMAPAIAFPVWTQGEMSKAQEAAIEQAASRDLRDPGSAQFRNLVRLVSDQGGEAYCGEINAKNAFGGYTGFVRFYYNPKVSERVIREDGDGADPMMVQVGCTPN